MTTKSKSEIRTAAKQAVKSLLPEQRISKSALIVKEILSLEAVKSAKVVALYASLPDEVISGEAIDTLATQKQVVLPRVAGDDMDFYPYDPTAMEIGSFGISEPQSEVAIDPSKIDVIIVPGVAFTLSGVRCGRGKGYYDKYLSRNGFRAIKIGVCYKEQLAEKIPSEPHDILMDCIICY
jgi:5-formyltetrahydrofolate cyclo-ligase